MSLKAFLGAHRAALWALGGGAAALVLFWAARSSRPAMNFWVDRVSMPVKRGLGAVTNPLPFSVCEAGATLLILGALVFLVRAVWQAFHGCPAALGAWALHLAVWLVWIYVGVCALWGTQYYADSFAEKAGMTGAGVSVEQLAAVTRYFGQQAAACAGCRNHPAPLLERYFTESSRSAFSSAHFSFRARRSWRERFTYFR